MRLAPKPTTLSPASRSDWTLSRLPCSSASNSRLPSAGLAASGYGRCWLPTVQGAVRFSRRGATAGRSVSHPRGYPCDLDSCNPPGTILGELVLQLLYCYEYD